MLAWFALLVAAVAAFGVMGIALGIFKVDITLRDLLAEVADLITCVHDDEEDDLLPLDDADYDIDEDTERAFIEIAEQLGEVEQLGDEIVDEEHG